jgi:hypothetical protein
MRRFSDIDILIPAEKLDDADRALKEVGYYFWADPAIHEDLPKWFRKQAPSDEKPRSEAASKRILATFHKHHLYVLKQEDPRMHVEVHWNTFLPNQGGIPPEDLWSETRLTNLEEVETLTLNYEATFIHAAVHAIEQPPTEFKLLHLADVAWMLWKWRDLIDPEKLRSLARRWKLSGFVTAAVAAAKGVLPQGLPRESDRVWPVRGPARERLLQAAGFGPWIVDQCVPDGRTGRLVEQVRREMLWETALGRPPASAWGRMRRAARARLQGFGRAGPEVEGEQ